MTRLIRPFDFILDANAGWRAFAANGVVAEDGPLRLEQLASTLLPLTEPGGTFGGHALPRGVAIWGDEIFISDPARHRILHWRPCCGPATAIPTIGAQDDEPRSPSQISEECRIPEPAIGDRGHEPRRLNSPLGLAISSRNDLVVADSQNHRLLVFTLPGFALRRIIGPYRSRGLCAGMFELLEEEWLPVDVASGPGGALYVADANGSIWRLDSQGRPDPCYPGHLPAGVTPMRVLVDCNHRAYVITVESDEIVIFDRYGARIPSLAELPGRVSSWLSSHRLEDNDENQARARAAILPEALSLSMDAWMHKRKLDSTAPENQAAAYRALLPQFLRDVLPASRLSLQDNRVLLAPAGPQSCQREPQPTDLYVDEAGRLVHEDHSDNVFLLRQLPAAAFTRDGVFRTLPLDGNRVGNPWHRILLELQIPERTGVRMFSFTSEVLRPDLDTAGLLDEPPRAGLWQAAPDNAGEWLIQSPPGRYLYLALVLKGPGDRTPIIERIYLYAQRQSSLRYLPAVYQADETSRHVLDRLLSLCDSVFGEIESEIEDFPLRLDVGGAPEDFLPWLASWFDLILEQSWSDKQRRVFLKNIVRLYRGRGTLGGLRLLLQLHTELEAPLPQIVEHFRGAGIPGLDAWLGEPPAGDVAHHFTVLLPGNTINTPDKRGLVTRLIDANKPAHTHFTLRPVLPGLRLGSNTTCGAALGLDSLLGSHAVWQLPTENEADGILGGRTILASCPMPRSIAVRVGYTRLQNNRLGCRTYAPCEES